MAISEAARADLYTGLADAIGPKRADIGRMQGNLDRLRSDMETGFAELRLEFKSALDAQSIDLRKSFSNWMLTLLVTIVGAMVGIGLLV